MKLPAAIERIRDAMTECGVVLTGQIAVRFHLGLQSTSAPYSKAAGVTSTLPWSALADVKMAREPIPNLTTICFADHAPSRPAVSICPANRRIVRRLALLSPTDAGRTKRHPMH